MRFKEKLNKNKMTIGSWITIGNPFVTEIIARAGFDWLAVDMEHSAITLDLCQQLIQVIELSGVVPLVRVEENNPVIIKRVMDAGAHGVIVPMVNSKAEAMQAVRAVRYPPIGTRGVGLARAQGYGMEFEKYKAWVNAQSVVVVQIEHINAVEQLEEIVTTEGVDGSIIGPYDLSASLGYPGNFERKEVKEAINRYISVCEKLKKPMGFHVIQPDADKVQEKIKEGFKFLAFSLDALFLGTKIREELKELKINIV